MPEETKWYVAPLGNGYAMVRQLPSGAFQFWGCVFETRQEAIRSFALELTK